MKKKTRKTLKHLRKAVKEYKIMEIKATGLPNLKSKAEFIRTSVVIYNAIVTTLVMLHIFGMI